jgi:transposase
MILPASVRVWLATEPVDMRRGHDGLLALVNSLGIADPYSGHLFVFLGRRADRCKILFWDRGGFVVAYKRLERGRFRLPTIPPDAQSIALDATALTMLLDGIDVKRVRRPELWAPKKCGPPSEGGSTRDPKFDPTCSWRANGTLGTS